MVMDFPQISELCASFEADYKYFLRVLSYSKVLQLFIKFYAVENARFFGHLVHCFPNASIHWPVEPTLWYPHPGPPSGRFLFNITLPPKIVGYLWTSYPSSSTFGELNEKISKLDWNRRAPIAFQRIYLEDEVSLIGVLVWEALNNANGKEDSDTQFHQFCVFFATQSNNSEKRKKTVKCIFNQRKCKSYRLYYYSQVR